MEIVTIDIALVVLLLVIAAVAIATRLTKLPYPIALILTGLGFAVALRALPSLRELPLSQVQLTPRLILVLFLPALLFESTLHIEASMLRRTWLPIVALAIPGVVVTAGIVGALIHWGVGLDWPTSLLFGALISATDPIAVVAIFKRLGAPLQLEVIVEGESLFNDGTAVVLARIMLGVVVAGTFAPVAGVIEFITVVGGGLLLGVATGVLLSRLIARLDNHQIEITLTMILSYGTFMLGEALHVSGVIAVVAAGLVMGNVGARAGMSPVTRLALLTFWEYVAFLLNSIIFLLIGLQVDLGGLVRYLPAIGIAIAAVLIARALVVYGFGVLLRPLLPHFSRQALHPLFWAGLRGAVSLAVVLSLPVDLPNRTLLLNMTFGVVLFTLLVQGLTMGPLLRRIGIGASGADDRVVEGRRTQLLMLRAAQHELQAIARPPAFSERVYEQLDAAYDAANDQLQAEIERLEHGDGMPTGHVRAVEAQLLQVEQATLDVLQQHGAVDGSTAAELETVLEERRAAVPSVAPPDSRSSDRQSTSA